MDASQEEGALNYEELLMGGLVSDVDTADCLDNLNHLLSKVALEKLSKENQALVQCMISYRDETSNKGALTEDVLIDMLMDGGASPEIQVKYQELYHKYQELEVSLPKFRYAVTRFLQKVEEREYVEALGEAYTVYTQGKKLGKADLKGYKDSKDLLNKRLYELTQLKSSSGIREGNLRTEGRILVEEMSTRREEPQKYRGVMTGIKDIDESTNGFKPGELIFIGGFTGVGKTFVTLNAAHHACTVQGLNVAIGTAEVLYSQYRQRFLVRHARNPVWGLPQGIDSKAFETGNLNPEEQAAFTKAMEDWETNQSYGSCYLFQIPKGAEISWIHNKLVAYNSVTPLDAFYLDSLALVTPVGKGDQKRNAMNDMIKEAKSLATNFDNQRGLPIISPWHSNRKSWEKALKDGYYTLGSWSEADELERSADIMVWLLKLENAADTHEIQSGFCKNRSGKESARFTLYEDFASAYIGSVSSGKTGLPGEVTMGGVVVDSRLKDLF